MPLGHGMADIAAVALMQERVARELLDGQLDPTTLAEAVPEAPPLKVLGEQLRAADRQEDKADPERQGSEYVRSARDMARRRPKRVAGHRPVTQAPA